MHALYLCVCALLCHSIVFAGEHSILKALLREDTLEEVLNLVDQGLDPNDPEPESGWTPLIFAAYAGNNHLTEFLILAGASVDKACNDGWTPLMFAARHGHPITAQTLLANGADVFKETPTSITPLIAAEISGSQETVSVISNHIALHRHEHMYISHSSKTESLILPAAHKGDDTALLALLGEGHDVNEMSLGGWTPLLLAAASGSSQAVRVLVEAGADINAQDHDGWTALMLATHSHSMSVVQVLMDAGANALLRNKEDLTAKDLAVKEGFLEVAEPMYPYGLCTQVGIGNVALIMDYVRAIGDANVQCERYAMYTPLIVACKELNATAVAELLKLGADPSEAEQDGWTPLMFATVRNSLPIVKLLLRSGADILTQTKTGAQALDLAESHASAEMVSLIRNVVEKVHNNDKEDSRTNAVEKTPNLPEEQKSVLPDTLQPQRAEGSIVREEKAHSAGAMKKKATPSIWNMFGML